MDNRKIKTEDAIRFLLEAQDNWVIVDKNGNPVRHENGDVMVFSCMEDLMSVYDKKSDQYITTERTLIQRIVAKFKDLDDYETSMFY